MLKPIFIDEKLQHQFEKDGYVVVRSLLSLSQVQHLRQLYAKYSTVHYGDKLGVHSSSHTSNMDMLREINAEFVNTVGDTIARYLVNYKFYMSNYLVKESRPDSLFDMHQDWTCVDESRYCSWNIWMDLQGTDKNNGYMFFLKGSHRIVATLRYSPKCPTPFENIRSIAPYYYSYLNTNAGDVVFLNNACIHGSVVNRSGKTRLAAILGAYSADADLLHYYCDPEDTSAQIEKYIVTTESLVKMPRGQRPPESKFDGYVSYHPQQVDPDEFIRFMRQNSSIKERGTFLLRRLQLTT